MPEMTEELRKAMDERSKVWWDGFVRGWLFGVVSIIVIDILQRLRGCHH